MIAQVKGHCSQCHKVWRLETKQGVCPWCGKPASCQTQRTKPRSIKSSSKPKQRQAPTNDNGYDQLGGKWLTYYKIASRFSHKAKAEDREDLLHDIILTLLSAERNNGDKPFSQVAMLRIASRAQAHYWYRHYKLTMGLDCQHCSKEQRQKCRKEWLYADCPKAIKLESLNKPIVDDEGNLTELGELIADDKAIDLDGWVSENTWEIGYPQRLVDIAHKLKAGIPLTNADLLYLSRYRRREQKGLFD